MVKTYIVTHGQTARECIYVYVANERSTGRNTKICPLARGCKLNRTSSPDLSFNQPHIFFFHLIDCTFCDHEHLPPFHNSRCLYHDSL